VNEELLREILGEVRGIKQEMSEMRQDLNTLKQNFDILKYGMVSAENRITQGLASLEAKMTESFDGVVSMIDVTQNHIIEMQKSLSVPLQTQDSHDEQLDMHNDSINILSAKILQHETEITLLKKKIGIPA